MRITAQGVEIFRDFIFKNFLFADTFHFSYFTPYIYVSKKKNSFNFGLKPNLNIGVS